MGLGENSGDKNAVSLTPCLNGMETESLRKTKASITVSECFKEVLGMPKQIYSLQLSFLYTRESLNRSQELF